MLKLPEADNILLCYFFPRPDPKFLLQHRSKLGCPSQEDVVIGVLSLGDTRMCSAGRCV